jgi:hypothetical protein
MSRLVRRQATRNALVALAAATAAITIVSAGSGIASPEPPGTASPTLRDDDDSSADASGGLDLRASDERSVVAAFARRSYRPGETAVLRLWHRYPAARLEILHIGPGSHATLPAATMAGVSVRGPTRVAPRRRSVAVPIGDWESGVYAARLTSAGKVGFAPFIVRPRYLGHSRVAVVQPTHTWQAYNFRDADGDGLPDTWYFSPSQGTVDVARPYLDRGVPPHFRQYDYGFLVWLARRRKAVDMLAQEDVEQMTGDRLARLYRLIVFPGHHEYVTENEYDAVERYRNLGGNLAFLSANNFFWRVDRRGDRITRVARWRDLGRPEAALVGVEYFRWNLGVYKSRQYIARGVHRAPWLFAGTHIRNGEPFGWWGIELDGRVARSPRSTVVVANMARAFGTDRAAEMTYYETPAGARVFAAGAFTLGGAAATWTSARLLENLWRRLTV